MILNPELKFFVQKNLIFKNVEEVKKVEFTPEMKEILCYDGPSSFVNDLKSKLNLYGKLSEKQIQAGLNQIQKIN